MEPRPTKPDTCEMAECSNIQDYDVTDNIDTQTGQLTVRVSGRDVHPVCPDEKGNPQSLRVKVQLVKRTCVRKTVAPSSRLTDPLLSSTQRTYWDCED